MNPTSPGVPAPYVQVQGAQAPQQGMGTANAQLNNVTSAANIGHGSSSKFAGKRGAGRIFGAGANFDAQHFGNDIGQQNGNFSSIDAQKRSPSEIMHEIRKPKSIHHHSINS